MSPELSAKFTLWCSRLIAAAVVVLIFVFPSLLRWYSGIRPFRDYGQEALAIAFYLCVPVVEYALWCIDRLVTNVLKLDVFVEKNTCYIRRIRWCCVGVSVICLPASFFYPPLVFMVVIMAFLALVVSMVKNIMAAAIEMREENDLTI
ncbi:MAG: DUF2975 domain-containing protein [Lachnospiraceae bacterium]|nr:DUF2975 domain-containing protein [Lachnospiraceae bacterium]